MCGISRYEKNDIKFDTNQELHEMNTKRVLNLQKSVLENISFEVNKSIPDKNYIYENINYLLVINKVLNYKIIKYEKQNIL